MYQKNFRILITVLILLIFTFIQAPPSSGKAPKKVAILPFTMNADRDLTFLQEGIVDMLGSRLAWKGEVEILEKAKVKNKVAQFKGPLNKEKAFLIGKALKVVFIKSNSPFFIGRNPCFHPFCILYYS